MLSGEVAAELVSKGAETTNATVSEPTERDVSKEGANKLDVKANEPNFDAVPIGTVLTATASSTAAKRSGLGREAGWWSHTRLEGEKSVAEQIPG